MKILFESCLEKQEKVKGWFAGCKTAEQTYAKLIELGRSLPALIETKKTDEHLVKGCQSRVYLTSEWFDGTVVFAAESDALISSGLAALLIHVYSGEPPEVILKCPPDCLDALGIRGSLTPNRANGLYSMHLKMKQEALHLLVEKTSSC